MSPAEKEIAWTNESPECPGLYWWFNEATAMVVLVFVSLLAGRKAIQLVAVGMDGDEIARWRPHTSSGMGGSWRSVSLHPPLPPKE